MDLSKYRGVQTVEMDRTDAFLPTLFMWDFTCQQCYPPYTKPQIQAGIQVLHATEMGISFEGKHGQEKYRPFMGKIIEHHQAERIFFVAFPLGKPISGSPEYQAPTIHCWGENSKEIMGLKARKLSTPPGCSTSHDMFVGPWGPGVWPVGFGVIGVRQIFRVSTTQRPCGLLALGDRRLIFFFDLGVTGKETPGHVPSGNLTVCYWKWPFIVSFPIKNGDFP